MVLTKDELMKRIKERVGEDKSDEALKFIEDITDTYNDLETKLTPNKKSDEEWQKELEAKDNEWREKYKARFFDSGAVDETKGDPLIDPPKKEKSPEETITFDDLFESEEKNNGN